jgi:hypothetical protein
MARVLRELLALKRTPCSLSDSEAVNCHNRVFPLVDFVVKWIEANWPAEPRL